MASSPLLNSLSSLFLSFRTPSSQLSVPLPSSCSPPTPSIKFQKPLSQAVSNDSNSSLSPAALSVLYPSAVYSNTLFFKSGCNVEVIVDEDESAESIVERFRREVFRNRVIQDCKRRRWHETNLEKRKRKSKEAAQRYGSSGRRRQLARMQQQTEDEQIKEVDVDEYDESKDNWEYSDVDLN